MVCKGFASESVEVCSACQLLKDKSEMLGFINTITHVTILTMSSAVPQPRKCQRASGG